MPAAFPDKSQRQLIVKATISEAEIRVKLGVAKKGIKMADKANVVEQAGYKVQEAGEKAIDKVTKEE